RLFLILHCFRYLLSFSSVFLLCNYFCVGNIFLFPLLYPIIFLYYFLNSVLCNIHTFSYLFDIVLLDLYNLASRIFAKSFLLVSCSFFFFLIFILFFVLFIFFLFFIFFFFNFHPFSGPFYDNSAK